MNPRQLALPTRRQATSAWIDVDRPLTIHSTGLGVESNAFTILVNEDPRFEMYRPDAYVHVDTGGELPHTHNVMLASINEYLAQHDQEILVIAPDDERYQTPSRSASPQGGGDRCGGRTSYVDPNARYVEVRYPLVKHGVTRADCYDVLHERNMPALTFVQRCRLEERLLLVPIPARRVAPRGRGPSENWAGVVIPPTRACTNGPCEWNGRLSNTTCCAPGSVTRNSR